MGAMKAICSALGLRPALPPEPPGAYLRPGFVTKALGLIADPPPEAPCYHPPSLHLSASEAALVAINDLQSGVWHLWSNFVCPTAIEMRMETEFTPEKLLTHLEHTTVIEGVLSGLIQDFCCGFCFGLPDDASLLGKLLLVAKRHVERNAVSPLTQLLRQAADNDPGCVATAAPVQEAEEVLCRVVPDALACLWSQDFLPKVLRKAMEIKKMIAEDRHRDVNLLRTDTCCRPSVSPAGV